MDLKFSTANHPQTDGLTERVDRTIEQILRSVAHHRKTSWKDMLPMCEFAYNDMVQASTCEIPFFMNHGLHPISIPEFVFASPPQPETDGLAVRILLRVLTGLRSNRKLWLSLRIASAQRWISRSSMRTNRGRTLLLRKGRWCSSTEIFCRQRFPETSHVRSWHRDGWVHLRSWRFRTWQLCECNCRDLAKLTRCVMWQRLDIFMKMCP